MSLLLAAISIHCRAPEQKEMLKWLHSNKMSNELKWAKFFCNKKTTRSRTVLEMIKIEFNKVTTRAGEVRRAEKKFLMRKGHIYLRRTASMTHSIGIWMRTIPKVPIINLIMRKDFNSDTLAAATLLFTSPKAKTQLFFHCLFSIYPFRIFCCRRNLNAIQKFMKYIQKTGSSKKEWKKQWRDGERENGINCYCCVSKQNVKQNNHQK